MPNSPDALISEYLRVRGTTERLAEPLSDEDQCLQSMGDCSPTKWHRAHTSWFFEAFILGPRGVAPHNPAYNYLFNSYYEALGARHPRPQRGLLSRPSVGEVREYRRVVDGRMTDLLASVDSGALARLEPLVALGLAHEQQHQELLLTDILHAFAQNPLRPAYRGGLDDKGALCQRDEPPSDARFVTFEGGLATQGTDAEDGFCFDNEEPAHRVFLEPFALSDRLVTVGEWKAFAEAGGYSEPSLWLAEGFDWIKAQERRVPTHAEWDETGQTLLLFGLDGVRVAEDDEPMVHLSYYEADALAAFHGARLPTEAEWEWVARRCAGQPEGGLLLETGALRALPCGVSWSGPGQTLPARTRPGGEDGPAEPLVYQMYGHGWEWTQSSYAPYPGYHPRVGAVGEYNGKFMVNQQVLRGGSAFTPRGHIRASYRNFWPPSTGFQMTAARLARSL